MKKKVLIISIIIISIITLFVLLLGCQKSSYIIKTEMVDEFSPDRKLVVYEKGNVIDFEEIYYVDGTLLCNKSNPTVSKSDIKDEKEFKVKINDKKIVIAKMEDVK